MTSGSGYDPEDLTPSLTTTPGGGTTVTSLLAAESDGADDDGEEDPSTPVKFLDCLFESNDALEDGGALCEWDVFMKRPAVVGYIHETIAQALVVIDLPGHALRVPYNAETERHARLSPTQATFHKDDPEADHHPVVPNQTCHGLIGLTKRAGRASGTDLTPNDERRSADARPPPRFLARVSLL